MSPRIIGLVGPSCAGKNLAARLLQQRGFAVIDADLVAHRVLLEKQNEVIATFQKEAQKRGIELSTPEGKLDRRALGSLLFPNPDLLARHEALIYPRLTELIEQEIQELSEASNPASNQTSNTAPDQAHSIVINAALLHKTPLIHSCDLIIFIDACYCVRLIRALKRDKTTLFRIIERFSAQKKLFSQYLEKNVDIVKVDNSTSVKALSKKLNVIFSRN